ncbi:hypothetical protein ACFQGX_09960 [Nonomuraea dietziae]|uniref:hypothetical protein n=1 Tax=Nonomuraea dietziae TaxID=65515 RepID=UPI003621AE47
MKRLLVLTALLSLPLTGTAQAAAPATKIYHAAPGATGHACNENNPCSLETARDKVREAVAGGMNRDIEVRLAGGVYRMAEPLVLDGRDSGPGGHTVTWTAAPGAAPVLSGGVPITGWRQEGGLWVAPALRASSPGNCSSAGCGRSALAARPAPPASATRPGPA